MRLIKQMCAIAAVVLSASSFGLSQKTTPEAYLRASYECSWPKNSGWPNSQPPATCAAARPGIGAPYVIEIYMPEKLAAASYKELVSNKFRLGTVFADNEVQPYLVRISKNDPPQTSDDKGQAQGPTTRTRFAVELPATADLTKSYAIYFDYPVDDGNGGVKVIPYLVQVGKEYSINYFDDRTGCKDRLAVRVVFDDPQNTLKPVGKPAPAPDKIPLRFSSLMLHEYEHYQNLRLKMIVNYSNKLAGAKMMPAVSIEDSSKPVQPPPELHVFKENGKFVLPDANHTEWIPKPEQLPKLKVEDFDASRGKNSNRLILCIATQESIPTNDFSARTTFPDPAPGSGLPSKPGELPLNLDATGLKGRKTEDAPEVFKSTGDIGVRPVNHDLDIVSSFSSSVEIKTKKDPNDPNKTIKVKERTTRSTLDLLVAPFGIKSKICFNGPFKPCDELPKTPSTRSLYRVFTPFYLDAKVSTGKITDDTLSLNRILFGTKADYHWRLNNTAYPTYFVFTGKFSNASDRDFKQAEYKGTFEFKPVWSVLNHPLANRQALTQPAVIIDENNGSDPTKIFQRNEGGYEFVPLIGFELGRTWARRQPAAAILPSDTVKRLYVGMDITLNPFSRTTLSLTDTFYFRFEARKTDPRDNYFKGSIDFRLGKVGDNNRIAHSIYFSFEKGQQPPFSDSGVNALKLGYRIRGTNVFGY
jgi:hypothetical protein